MIAQLQKLIEPLKRRILLMFSRGRVESVNDGTMGQEMQISLLQGEMADRVERPQNYGFTSVPLPGADAFVAFIGGSRDHGVVLGVEDRRYRVKGLKGGEVAIYTDEDQAEDGCRIVLRRGNKVEIQAADIDFRAENRLHLSGRFLELHADERREMDVAGYGEALNYRGGLWQTDTYHDGAEFVPSMEHGVQPSEIEGFGAIAAAIKASGEVTSQDQLLLCIPEIAVAEASRASEPDKTGWSLLSVFLRKWFGGDASTDKAAQPPAFVSWDWLRQYSRVQTAWFAMADPDYLFSENAKSQLGQILFDTGAFTGSRVSFDHISVDWEQLDLLFFQQVSVDWQLDPVDGLTAAMGTFAIRAVATGYVDPIVSETSLYKVTVTGVAFYVEDGFDYEDDKWWNPLLSQPLGNWDCDTLTFGGLGLAVRNTHFQEFRERYGRGGDFSVFVVPQAVADFMEFSYEI
ncbi:MAG: phage baseplate assembly protein [Pseudodesulfovibrio sp.]|nr:phage baseplate assembly protein [Pseudodesulfovibrio sp.]